MRRCGGILIPTPHGCPTRSCRYFCVRCEQLADFSTASFIFPSVSPVSFPREYRFLSDGRIHRTRRRLLEFLLRLFAVQITGKQFFVKSDSSACRSEHKNTRNFSGDLLLCIDAGRYVIPNNAPFFNTFMMIDAVSPAQSDYDFILAPSFQR